MDNNLPLNSTHKISVLKKVVLFINVSAFRLTKGLPTLSNFRNSYHSRGASVALAVVIEYILVKYLFPYPKQYWQLRVLFFGFFFHGLIDILFIKDIIIMAGNYNAYYNKILFYLFLICAAIGFVGSLIILNNQIGHVKK
ncbi:MAG TPA: hypothetical protein VGN20_29125 [Mucilaginibacter sp.]|jgi:hypothetical protein